MESTEKLVVPPEDKTLMPPLHQKRIVAFINHFLISSCSFLNNFSQRCESKFITLERKMQKIEAALVILEEKLDSVPTTQIKAISINSQSTESPQQAQPTIVPVDEDKSHAVVPEETKAPSDTVKEPIVGIRACDDTRYRKFFKMVQFGVPAQAVKLKMRSEGIENTSILDTPNLLLPDGISYEEAEN